MRALEEDILKESEHLLTSYSARLRERGLSYRPPMIDVRRDEADSYESELRVIFIREDQIVDVLEFHVFWHGEAYVTPHEAIQWMTAQLDEMLADPKATASQV